MIPMLRTLARSRAVVAMWLVFSRYPVSIRSRGLPVVVGESLVGLRHLVRVLAALDAGAEPVAGVHQLVEQTLRHGLLTARPRVADEPAQREGGAPGGADLGRKRVGGATDAAAAQLQGGLDVVERALEHEERVLPGLLPSALERAV